MLLKTKNNSKVIEQFTLKFEVLLFITVFNMVSPPNNVFTLRERPIYLSTNIGSLKKRMFFNKKKFILRKLMVIFTV
jgi:hypothetical protein